MQLEELEFLAQAFVSFVLSGRRSLLGSDRIDESGENGGLQRQATRVCGYLELQSIPATLADQVVSLQELLA